MESYGGAGCVDCYREHCRQQTPSARVPSLAAAPDCRLSLPRHRHATACRRLDLARRSCRLLVAGSFVFGLILVPCAMSVPIDPQYGQQQQQQQQQQQELQLEEKPFWHNPCGTQTSYEGSGSGPVDGYLESDSPVKREEIDLMQSIVVSTNQALMHAQQFTETFVEKTFHADFKTFHGMWKHLPVDWLRQAHYMPKELDVPLNQSYLDSLTFKNVLPAVYVGMQYVAVGLEQVALDQARDQQPFAKDFTMTTFKLRAILCEMSTAMAEMNEPETQVSRSVMSPSLRDSTEHKALNEWLILRDYITSLQYVIETFEHLQKSIAKDR